MRVGELLMSLAGCAGVVSASAGCGRIGFDVPTGQVESVVDAATPSNDGGLPPLTTCVPQAGLAACWDFEGTLEDGSGQGHQVTTAFGYSFTSGIAGMGLATDGASQILVQPQPSLELPALTASAWVRPTGVPPVRSVVVDHDQVFAMYISSDLHAACAAGVVVQSASPLPLDAWTHVVCTHDGSAMAIYVNGVQEARLDSLLPGGLTTFGLAGNAPPGDPFLGTIDSLQIWSGARPP